MQDDDELMRLRVVCSSGHKAEERPLRFQLDDNEYFVEEVVDQWYGPDDRFFKVRASDGNLYVLRRRSTTPEDEWSLESYRDLTRRRGEASGHPAARSALQDAVGFSGFAVAQRS